MQGKSLRRTYGPDAHVNMFKFNNDNMNRQEQRRKVYQSTVTLISYSVPTLDSSSHVWSYVQTIPFPSLSIRFP